MIVAGSFIAEPDRSRAGIAASVSALPDSIALHVPQGPTVRSEGEEFTCKRDYL